MEQSVNRRCDLYVVNRRCDLYVSVTNSSAFSPTDSMPLSPRAKLLMATESVFSPHAVCLVIARGLSLLQ
jgi:hypothetical protein